MSTRTRLAFLAAAWTGSLAVGCHRDETATSSKPPRDTERLANDVAAARPYREPSATPTTPVETAQEAESELPSTLEAIRRRGAALEESGYLNEALRLYERALGQPGAPVEFLERKALVLGWLERFEASRATYRLVLEDPRSDERGRRRARRKLAELLAWQSRFDEALTDLDRLLAEDQADCESRLLRGQILEWQGRYPEAKVAYSKILEVDPHHDEARLRLDKLLWVP